MRRRDALRLVGAGTALALGGATTAVGRTAAIEPLATLELDGAKEAVVGADGYVYVAVTDGFAVVDASDPSAPTVVHEDRDILPNHDDGPLEGIYDVKVDGDRLAVTGPANGGPALRAVVVFDVSDPTSPSRVSVHETEFFNHNCDISDGVVVLCGNDGDRNPVVTVDAETGEELGRWSVLDAEPGWSDVSTNHWVIHDVSASDGVAYLAQWDSGTWMVDISDPANPSFVGKVRGGEPSEYRNMSSDESSEAYLQPPGNDHYAAANDDGSVVGISVEAWDIRPAEEDVRPGSLYLYDVSDPENATELAEIEAPETDDEGLGGTWTTAHNFELSGDLLISSWYQGGVRVYDVSDPTNPTLTVSWRDETTTSFWTAQRLSEDAFIATSRGNPGSSGGNVDSSEAALYVFPLSNGTTTPTPDGSMAGNVTATTSPSATPTGTPATPTATGAPSPTASRTDAPTDTRSPTGSATPSPGQPGLGVVATLAALGVGTWRLLGRNDD